MNNKTIVFIESNTSGTGYLFFRAASNAGLRPFLLAANPSLYEIPYSGVVVAQVDTGNVSSIMDFCYSLHIKGYKIAAVLTSSDYYVYTATVVAGALGLTGGNPFSVRDCSNKHIQRQKMYKHGMPVPDFVLISSMSELERYKGNIKLPAIIKPISGSGSFGVCLCNTESDLAESVEVILRKAHNERGIPVDSRALIEEYIDGPEYSIEMIGTQILGITKKHLGKLPYFVEVGHDFPALATTEIQESLVAAAHQIVTITGMEFGAKHIEARVHNGTIYIIEINPRLAGGFIPILMQYAFSGYDIISSLISLYIGEESYLEVTPTIAAALRFFVPAYNGLITTPNLTRFKHTPGVLEVKWYSQSDKMFEAKGDFRDRIGHVIYDTSIICEGEIERIIEQVLVEARCEL